MDYQAKLAVPFGVLGIHCDERELLGIDFLTAAEKTQRPTSAFAKTVCEQLLHYFDNPDFQFTVPLKPAGTPKQQKVWQAMLHPARRNAQLRRTGRRADIRRAGCRPGLRSKSDTRHHPLPSGRR